MKKALYAGEIPGLSFADVISDYSESYRKKQNENAICEAIIVAVNESKFLSSQWYLSLSTVAFYFL